MGKEPLMGLFSKKKEPGEAELQARRDNEEKLEQFQVTKAWGVKKYAPAMQFIYDEEHRQFVVVEGPEETFKERDPWVISFDEVKDVTLEVEEAWSEKGGQYDPKGFGNLLQDQYDKVFWRYDFYLVIDTEHPYAGTIRYPMNFKTTVTKVPERKFKFRRGFEIGGRYRGSQIADLVTRMEELYAAEEKALKTEKVVGIVTLSGPEGVLGKAEQDLANEKYLKKIANMTEHVKRARRISKLLTGE